MHRVLFVCTGNTCRSPMAEAILKNKNHEGVEVRSAGVYAMDGASASSNSITVMNENNITHNHQSSLLTHADVEWATVILAMTLSHKQAIISNYPQAASKTFTLKAFAGEDGYPDVSDPYGGDVDVYRATFAELEQLIDKAMKRLLRK
jgi:protein arginine phosphatase